jgi:hypothetical protein
MFPVALPQCQITWEFTLNGFELAQSEPERSTTMLGFCPPPKPPAPRQSRTPATGGYAKSDFLSVICGIMRESVHWPVP